MQWCHQIVNHTATQSLCMRVVTLMSMHTSDVSGDVV